MKMGIPMPQGLFQSSFLLFLSKLVAILPNKKIVLREVFEKDGHEETGR